MFGHDVVATPTRSAAGSRSRAVRLRRRGPQRYGEPRAALPAARTREAGADRAGYGAARARSGSGGGRPAGEEVLRRHAAAHRHRGQHRRRPDLMFLDEPTTGLDPRSRNQVWEIVERPRRRRARRCCSTTQYLDEADQLADRISVIDAGRVIAEGTPGELKASVGAGSAARPRRQRSEQRPAAAAALEAASGASGARGVRPDGAVARITDPRRGRARARGAPPRGRRRSPSSPSASPASTRCSCQPHRAADHSDRGCRRPTGPPRSVPHDDDHDRRRARRGTGRTRPLRPACRARRWRATGATRTAVDVDDVRLARAAQDQARPGAALRRDGVPRHADADLHVPLRRRARRLGRGRTCSTSCPASSCRASS